MEGDFFVNFVKFFLKINDNIVVVLNFKIIKFKSLYLENSLFRGVWSDRTMRRNFEREAYTSIFVTNLISSKSRKHKKGAL